MQVFKTIVNLFPIEVHRLVWVAKDAALSPLFYVVVGFVFFLEKMIPVNKSQKIFSASLVQDFLWFQMDNLFQLTLIPFYIGFLETIYDRYLAFLTIHAVKSWPMGARFLMGFLVTDFLVWFHHFLRHRVKYFWFFHTIHHSQKATNIFTEGRFHTVEALIAWIVRFIPVFMLDLNGVSIFAMALIQRWYSRIYHANLRTNYGFLKYFMVTPQSHRIHHSNELRHRDKNFGVIFTIWDRLFGTLYKNYDEYPPETGIDDPQFPHEIELRGISFVATLARQFLYPFRLLIWDIQETVRRKVPVQVNLQQSIADSKAQEAVYEEEFSK